MRNQREHPAIAEQLDDSDDPGLEDTLGQIVASRGYVSNLMRTVAYAPDGLRALAAFGGYCRYGTELTERQRELAIVVALHDVRYGWQHHAPLAQAAGLSEAQLLLIQAGRVPRDLDAPEFALCEFAFEITACRRVPPRIEEAVQQLFSPRQIVDIVLLTSYYMAVAAMTIALDVQIEPPEVLQLEQAWQARRNRR